MLECVINVSEGRDQDLLDEIGNAASTCLLDRHSDPVHNRSVFTLAGSDVLEASLRLARSAVAHLDLANHEGIHPRLGVVDVVPFVPIDGNLEEPNLLDAISARDRFARILVSELGVPCFFYGPERSLPTIRKEAFSSLFPDLGPRQPHPRAGACCVGARPVLIAYNLWLDDVPLDKARAAWHANCAQMIFAALAYRSEKIPRSPATSLHRGVLGPNKFLRRSPCSVRVDHAELVGLIPRDLLFAIDPSRWSMLGLDEQGTIEWRREHCGPGDPPTSP